jgi:hypothetical protein
VLSRQVAGLVSSGRCPGRSDALLRRVPADNGPHGWRPKDQRAPVAVAFVRQCHHDGD